MSRSRQATPFSEHRGWSRNAVLSVAFIALWLSVGAVMALVVLGLAVVTGQL